MKDEQEDIKLGNNGEEIKSHNEDVYDKLEDAYDRWRETEYETFLKRVDAFIDAEVNADGTYFSKNKRRVLNAMLSYARAKLDSSE